MPETRSAAPIAAYEQLTPLTVNRPNQSPATELVVLVPGVGFGGIELIPLAWALQRRRRARTAVFFYLPWCKSLDDSAVKLAEWLARRDEEVIHLVGHSLGGLVILQLLAASGWTKPGRIVTLGTPHRSIAAAGRIKRLPAGGWILGAAVRSALDGLPLPIPQGRDVGCIAGSVNVGLGALLSLPRPNDSIVGVEEAIHPHTRDCAVLRTTHTSMLFSRRVADKVDAFLTQGAFARRR